MTTAPDRYLDQNPLHLCVACVPPVHLECAILHAPMSAATQLFVLGETRFAGFSMEALHEAPWHPDCRASYPTATHHYSWWVVPLELLEAP